MTSKRSVVPSLQRRPGLGRGAASVSARTNTVKSLPLSLPFSPGVRPSASGILALQRAAGNAAVSGSLTPVQRKANKPPRVGVAKYGTTRLTDRLEDMMRRGVLGVAGAPDTLDRDQLFLLQGVANVETGGMDNAVYTKDNMYVSLGFKQVTMGWGSLYEIIKAVPASFAKYGIVLGSGTYTMMKESRPAIEGAPDPAVLKLPPWTDRFFDAGSEDAVVSAMVAYTLKELGKLERRFAHDSPGKTNHWMKDPTARAWLLETMNNRPVYAYTAAKGTLARTSGKEMSRDDFLAVLESEIVGVYAANDEAGKGSHIIAKIPRSGPGPDHQAARPGAQPGVTPAARPESPQATPAAVSQPSQGAGVDLVAKAAAVLPPTAAGAGAGGGALLQLIAGTGLLGPALRLLIATGHTDTTALTNLAFWAAHPDLFGSKLMPSQPGFAALAAEWMHLRDGLVKESASRATPKPVAAAAAKPAAANQPVAAATQPAPGLVPAAEIAAQSGASTAAETSATTAVAGPGDKYFTQNVGRYQDVSDTGASAGRTRVWLYGSSGANVCNMTSLTMALVSMVGEAEVRTKIISLLHSSGLHEGAQVQIGGSFVSLEQALDDPTTVPRINTLDLVTAAAIGKHGSYKSVTQAATIARVAQDAGIASAKEETGQIHLSNPKVRARAAQMLADGKRVIVGTVNHYVYLVEIRGDGAVVHDPAGARVTPGLTGALFVHSGTAAHIAGEFLGMDAERQQTALRRVTTNPEAAAVINALPSIAAMSTKAERAAAVKQLSLAHPGQIATGPLNFYATNEFTANDLRLRVTLSAPAH